MPVIIKPTSEIKKRLGIQPNGPVHAFFTETCYKHMDKYVPMSELPSKGDLRTNVDVETDTITYESDYAKYQYYGIRKDGTHEVHNYTTPGTGPYWKDRMVSAEMQDVEKEVQDFINHGGK